MDKYESLSHTKWECKYHVVFIPKCRRRTLYAELRKHLAEVFRELARQKESRIEEGHLMPDHAHMLLQFRRSTRCRGWWDISKGKARFIWHAPMAKGSETLSGSISG